MQRRGFLAYLLALLGIGTAKGAVTLLDTDGAPDMLDWRNDPGSARHWDVIDVATGKSHTNGDIFHADRRHGIIRYFKRNAGGYFYIDSKQEVAWAEGRCRIRFARKAA